MNKVLESNLFNYINKLYETENIEIDIRFAYYGDKNEFYGKDGSHFVRCEHYHVKDLSEVEKLIKYCASMPTSKTRRKGSIIYS